jgi:hypothetical protein
MEETKAQRDVNTFFFNETKKLNLQNEHDAIHKQVLTRKNTYITHVTT